jgi:DNA-binding NtrC family response regulator
VFGLRGDSSSDGEADFRAKVLRFERDLIVSALDACGQNQRVAARSLGIQPSTLHEKMKRLGLLTRHPSVG